MRIFLRAALIYLLAWSLGLQAAGIAAGGCELPAHSRGEATLARAGHGAGDVRAAGALARGHETEQSVPAANAASGGIACATGGTTTCPHFGFPAVPALAARTDLVEHHGTALAAPDLGVTPRGILRPPRAHA